jgi:TolB-like protein
MAAAALLLLAGLPAAVPRPERLCVLDFERIGDEGRVDWLRRGLSEMLIITLAGHGELEVIEREHVQAVLAEHGLASSGIVDPDTSARQARILRADLLLAGSFALVPADPAERLLVQARLIRVADQGLLAEASWEGAPEDVLQAPARLCEVLLGERGSTPAGLLPGLAERIPRRVDVAAAYYGGIGAFEDGDYPAALASWLEGAGLDDGFLPVERAVIRAYHLLELSEHAVVFAARLGNRLVEEGRIAEGLEFTYAAAELAALAGADPGAVLAFLEAIVARAKGEEQRTGEFAASAEELARAFSPEAAPEARKLGEELRFRLARSLEQEGWWQEQAAGSRRDESGVVKAREEPGVFAWRVRAQRDLARAYAACGRLADALASYREILDACAPLHRLADDGLGSDDALRTEAHFMWLRDYARTGRLEREHALRDLNALNVVEEGRAFERDFADPAADPRARTASRYTHRGHEFFDFASPEGFQIDALELAVEMDGLAEFSLYVPEVEGWPPRYSFSRRVRQLPFLRPGNYRETIRLPAGTELVSVSSMWGSDPFPPLDAIRGRRPGLPVHRDIRRWRATFELSPLDARPRRADAPLAADFREADRKLIEHYAGRFGWELGAVLRASTAPAVADAAGLDADGWMVAALDGDLLVLHRDRALRAELPVAINTPEREFDAALVPTPERSWALLWSRGNDEREAERYVARTRDFLRWETPRHLRFAPPADATAPAVRAGELEGTSDVCALRDGYLMLVERGFARRSGDLRHWDRPLRILERDAWRSALSRTADGWAWAVCLADSEVLEPYTPADRLCGYFVIDGKRYRHTCALRVAASRDGRAWEERGRLTLAGQGSGLWAFPLSGDAIGIGVQFNARFMRWFALSSSGGLREIGSALELQTDSPEAVFFAREGRILSLRPVFDYFGEQRTVLLGAGSRRLFEEFAP